MNCLLAASPTLTLQTYTICTALSLFKVMIHAYIGASIHSFKNYPLPKTTAGGNGGTDWMAQGCTVIGVALCIGVLVYLGIVGRKAIDSELGGPDVESGHTTEIASHSLSRI